MKREEFKLKSELDELQEFIGYYVEDKLDFWGRYKIWKEGGCEPIKDKK